LEGYKHKMAAQHGLKYTGRPVGRPIPQEKKNQLQAQSPGKRSRWERSCMKPKRPSELGGEVNTNMRPYYRLQRELPQNPRHERA
jgi:hypothetical protein